MSGATSVKILRKRFRNAMVGLCLDVWGDQRSVLLIEDSNRDLEQMSTLFVRSSAAIERQLIHGAYLNIFENSAGPTADLVLDVYKGSTVQTQHQGVRDADMLYVPRLLNPSASDAYSLERFVDCVMRQVEFLNRSYDETLFGELRAVISYGTCYIVAESPPPSNMTEEQFVEKLNVGLPTNNENLVNPDRAMRRPQIPRAAGRRPWNPRRAGYRNEYSSMRESFPNLCFHPTGRRPRGGSRRGRTGRSRGQHSERGSNRPACWRQAYAPARKFQMERFYSFLRDNGFEVDEDYQVYQITVKLKMSGYQSNIDSVLLLDEQLRLKGLTMTDTKWVCVNIFGDKSRDTGTTSGQPINDSRLRIHSRVSLSPLEMSKQSEDCTDLIHNHGKLLKRDQRGNVVGVDGAYKKRIHFVRQKYVQVYQLPQNPQVHVVSASSFDKYSCLNAFYHEHQRFAYSQQSV